MATKFRQVSALISKSISGQTCFSHRKPFSIVCLETLKLGCISCAFANKISIQSAVSNPIQIAICHINNSGTYKDTDQLRYLIKCKNQQNKIKIGFQALVQEIRATINNFCNQLLSRFQCKWNQAFAETNQKMLEINNAQAQYRKVFEQLLENRFVNGSVSQLQDCFNQFCNHLTEDPSEYVESRIKQWKQSLKMLPIINWDQLKNVYKLITDPETLKIQEIIEYSEFSEIKIRDEGKINLKTIMLLPQIMNRLQKKKFFLKFDSKSVSLHQQYQKGKLKEVSRLQQQNDAYFQLSHCRIVGLSYCSLTIFSYALDTILIERSYPISGCSNILAFPQCLILQAQGRIVRLWLSDGHRQVISLSGSEISYVTGKSLFTYQNGKGEVVTHSGMHNQK